MTPACIAFGRRVIDPAEIAGRRVLEVGAFDVNGSFRPFVEAMAPASYIGVDIQPGRGIDEICDASGLVERYGHESFDVVITTEMIEHVLDWRTVAWNLKSVLRMGGLLVLTTRAPGFARHDWPGDHWRYTRDDLLAIFGDLSVGECIEDRTDLGAFIVASRHGPVSMPPADFLPHVVE